MESYDPLIPPDPAEWEALDEDLRIVLVRKYHEQAGIEIPGMDLHATMHVVIEGQLADAGDSVIMANYARLMAGGLNRHEAIHAMAFEMTTTLHLAQKRPDANFNFMARYHGGLKRLKPRDWRGTA